MQDQQQPHSPLKEFRENVNILVGFSQAFCMPARLLWAKAGTAGEMFFGGRHSLVGYGFLFFWPVLFPRQDTTPVWAFFGLVTVLLLLNRWMHCRYRRKGYRPHSLYVGLSRLEFLFGDRGAKRFGEPLATGILGLLVLTVSDPLGMYLVWASFAMLLSTGWQHASEESMLRRMRDAKIEQECLAERLREDEL